MLSNERKIRKTAGIYNMIPNLFWSALLLIPVSVFCYSYMNRKWFWIFLSISMLAVFLPKSFFDAIQLGKTSAVYKKSGVKFINRFTQNGDIINDLMRKKYPDYKVVSAKDISIHKLIEQTYVFEKFHFILFLFFLFILIYAIGNGYFIWVIVFFISNIVYNVYPMWLQQYIRVRLKTASKRTGERL